VTDAQMQRTRPGCPSIQNIDRNVVLPFTTPLLVGTRARPRHGSGIELLVPNPAGGRGFYVIDPASLPHFCRLTLHDELLLEELLALEIPTPAAIRRAARKVALTGAAGREAAEAAARAAKQEDAVVQLAEVLLLLETLAAAGIEDFDPRKLDPDDGSVRSYLKSRLGQFASAVGMHVDELFDALEEIAFHAAGIGFPSGGFESRHRRTLRRVADLAASLGRWAAVETEEVADLARRIGDAAIWTCETAKPVLDEAQALLDDIPRLLRLWRGDSGAVKEQLALCDWLLDGWIEVCSIWEAAGRDSRTVQRATLQQIEKLLPVSRDDIRSEDRRLGEHQTLQRSRCVRLYEDWRTGVVITDWLERREALRAGALA
jgi:hypothetical protein